MTDPAVAAAVAKTREIRNEMKNEVVERGVEIDLLLASIIAKVHMLLLGPPGVAKSMMVDQFLLHVDGATLFSHLLNKQTPPDALVGPISFQAMKEDRFRRVTTGRLPEANIAFLDEIFKSNAVNLNLLLKMANERLFENDGEIISVPLWSIIAASNELPGHDKEELIAFSDRMGIRRVVAPVRTEDGMREILTGQIARNKGEEVALTHTTLTVPEIELLQKASTEIEVPGRVMEKVAELQARAERENLHISSRRMFEGVKICQAMALLSERGEVKSEDLRIFEHVLWNDPDELSIAGELTLDFAGTVGKQAARAGASLEEFQKRLSDAQGKMPSDSSEEPDKDVVNELTTIAASLTTLNKEVSQNIADAHSEGHDSAELESIAAEISRNRLSLRKTLGMDF